MEHLYIKAGVTNPSFSEQYLQWAVKVQLGVAAERRRLEHRRQRRGDPRSSAIVDGVGRSVQRHASGPRPTIPTASPTAPRRSSCRPSAGRRAIRRRRRRPRRSTRCRGPVPQHDRHQGAHHDRQDRGRRRHRLLLSGVEPRPVDAADRPQTSCTEGIVRYPNDDDVTESHKQRAGHGILIVGWDDDLEFQAVDKDGKPVVDADGKPVMQKGFYIFKNSWGTDVLRRDQPERRRLRLHQREVHRAVRHRVRRRRPARPAAGGPAPPRRPTLPVQVQRLRLHAPNQCIPGLAVRRRRRVPDRRRPTGTCPMP